MGSHMLPGRERWRALRRSIRFTMAAILAVPIVAVIAMWAFAGATISAGLAGHNTAQHGTVLIRIALADAIGLAAVLIAALLMTWFARRLARDVANMETTARRFADQQFAQFMARLRRGEHLDPDTDLPPPARTRITEVARAAAALASVQRTALAAAITETSLRSGISQVFVSLARRSQSLLQRQLRLLDDLERKAADPAALADLFPLDHLTTRMRRHAEGLIILSGAVPGRGWSNPVPVIDVVRGAIAEIEDYKRVAVVTTAEDMVAGSAVADMIHLMAELIENAAMFSPSGTRVEVRAERVGNGFAFEIEDRGLGIKPDELDAINERLGSPADFDLANADQLGLFVVGKLAARHGVRVFLRPSPYGGTTAIVVMPRNMIAPEAVTPAVAPAADAAAIAGRGDELQLALSSRPARRAPPAAGSVPAQHGSPYSQPGIGREQPVLSAQPLFPGLPGASQNGLPPRPDAGRDQPALPTRSRTGNQPVFPGLPGAGQSGLPTRPDAGRDQPALPTRSGPGSQPPFPDRAEADRDHQVSGLRPGDSTQPVFAPRPGDSTQPVFAPPEPQFAPPHSTQPVFPFQPGGTSRPGSRPGDSDQPVFPALPGTGAALPTPAGSPAPPASPASSAPPASAPTPGEAAGTHRGLPRRVRQASLSPHLRKSASAAARSSGPEARSPEQAQSLLSSLQRGWERGRETAVPEPEAAPGARDAESGAPDTPPEEA